MANKFKKKAEVALGVAEEIDLIRSGDTESLFLADVLAQVKSEYEVGMAFVRDKRDVMNDRLRLYKNSRRLKDKVGINTLFTVMNTLLAISYQDMMTVAFSGRDMLDDTKARNLSRLAHFDYDEMGMSTISYLKDWDRLFFGVGIRSISSWDSRRMVPVIRSHDPMSFIPDPSAGMDIKNFRFFGFDVSMTKAEMTSDKGFFNLDMIKMDESEYDDDSVLKGENRLYDLIDWYTVIDGSKYLLTLSNEMSVIIRFERVKALTDDEKKDPSLIPFPVVLNYYSPLRNDPFGTSVCDLVEDKQRAQSVLANLRIASEKSRLYPMYLYDRTKILNHKDLDFAFNKAVPVNGDIHSAVTPLTRDVSDSSNTLLNENSLNDHIRESVGADSLQTGVLSSKDRTLGEIQAVQTNASLRHLLHQKIDGWGEKQFWYLWYRMYKGYFSEAEKKVVRLAGGKREKSYLSIGRKDVIGVQDPDIVISSRVEDELNRARERNMFSSVYEDIAKDDDVSGESKSLARKHLLKLNGVNPEEADAMAN